MGAAYVTDHPSKMAFTMICILTMSKSETFSVHLLNIYLFIFENDLDWEFVEPQNYRVDYRCRIIISFSRLRSSMLMQVTAVSIYQSLIRNVSQSLKVILINLQPSINNFGLFVHVFFIPFNNYLTFNLTSITAEALNKPEEN